jgi:phage-related protein
MPSIGPRCHELRIRDENSNWRVVYRIDSDAVIIGEVFKKKSRTTPHKVIEACIRRFKRYDEAAK